MSSTAYYEHNGITIYHGRCEDVLPTLQAVDVVITDPPYEREAHTLQRRVNRHSAGYHVEELSFDAISPETRAMVGLEVARLAARWVVTFCQIEAAPVWRAAYEAGGLDYKRTCIWVKPDGMPQYSGDRPGMGYEAFVAMHPKGRSRWNGGGRHGVWIVNKGENLGRKNDHETQKPLRLMRDLVAKFSDPGELILDAFMGSGTTLVAAKSLGRRAVGIEMDERYCEIAARRLSQEVFSFSEAA